RRYGRTEERRFNSLLISAEDCLFTAAKEGWTRAGKQMGGVGMWPRLAYPTSPPIADGEPATEDRRTDPAFVGSVSPYHRAKTPCRPRHASMPVRPYALDSSLPAFVRLFPRPSGISSSHVADVFY